MHEREDDIWRGDEGIRGDKGEPVDLADTASNGIAEVVTWQAERREAPAKSVCLSVSREVFLLVFMRFCLHL